MSSTVMSTALATLHAGLRHWHSQ